MSIYEKAMELEKEGKEMYEKMGAEATDAGLKGVFQRLAAFEQNHYDVFKALAEKAPAVDVKELAVPSIKEIVAGLKKNTDEQGLDAIIEQYKQALALEEANEKVYLDFAAQATDTEEKRQFEAVADEEKKHRAVIQTIIDCIQGPVIGIESAEF